jgi:hypothetical protein
VFITFLPVIVVGQTPLRVIDKATWRSEPITIQKLRTDGKEIQLGKSFSAEGEWLKGLTVTVQNVSSKAIARIELVLAFRRAKGASPEVQTYVVRMIHGLDPSDPAYTEKQKPALPGETVELTLPEANLSVIKTDLKNLDYPEDTSHVQIRIDSVTFLDGSMWAADELLFPDPKNPARKINPRLQNLAPEVPLSYHAPLRGESSEVRFRKANFTLGLPVGFYDNQFSLRSLLTLQDETLPAIQSSLQPKPNSPVLSTSTTKNQNVLINTATSSAIAPRFMMSTACRQAGGRGTCSLRSCNQLHPA